MPAKRAPLYLMIKPPLQQRARLRQCVTAYGLNADYKAEHYHSTFVPLGDSDAWPAPRVGALMRELDTTDAAPFLVEYDLLDGNLLRGRQGLRGARAFRRLLVRRLAACGFALPDYDFWLHLSLAYEGPGRHADIEPIGWLAEDFRLIRSVHGEGHQELGRWPLRRRQLEWDF